MNELIQRASLYKYDFTGPSPHVEDHGGDNIGKRKSYTENEAIEKRNMASPILIAAKMGVTEMIEKILDMYPVAIQDVDSQNKNVVLLAIENRQPHVYSSLNKRGICMIKKAAFRQVDINVTVHCTLLLLIRGLSLGVCLVLQCKCSGNTSGLR